VEVVAFLNASAKQLDGCRWKGVLQDRTLDTQVLRFLTPASRKLCIERGFDVLAPGVISVPVVATHGSGVDLSA
jgi:hypothetical protein